MKQGIFYPELTLGAGASELSYNRKLELQQFLISVVRHRGHPLHLANLWNALYFNFDLVHGGFHADHIEQKRIPTRTAQQRDWSLPVGGFVRVHTEAACGDLLAEVVYKEGAHEALDDDGWLEPTLSGAPATVQEELVGDPVAVVRERFVLDLSAFGPAANAMTAKQYDRLCRKARWLDKQGHLLMDAMYTPDEAELEDIDYYADYLVKEHREGLLAFCFEVDLDEEELREALLRSFDAVRELALGARELRTWRGKYFFAHAGYETRLADRDGVLGGNDLSSIYAGLHRIPAGDERCYSAIGPRILELLRRDQFDDEEQALVRGCQYATAVCHANAYVSDRLARDQKNGVRTDGVHLRLDDDWQGGGIWRAEQVPEPERYSLRLVPALIPLGLGHAEAGAIERVEEPAAASEAQPLPTSQHGFRVALTGRDRILGRLRLSTSAAELLVLGDIDVQFVHDGEQERYPVERDGPAVYGVRFPLALHPGVVLHCNVERGGSVVRVRTERVTPPVVAADGRSFDFDTNLAVFEREAGLKELAAKEKAGAPSLAELVSRTFRSRGRRRDDGALLLSLFELAAVVLGPGWRAGDLRLIQQTVAEMGLERDGAEFVWRPRVTRHTRSSDRSLLAAYGETKARGRLANALRRHFVPMHLRVYTERSGRRPSKAKRLSYAEARRQFGMHGVLPEQLPEGATWVEPYSWGGEGEEPTAAQLEIEVG